VTGHGVFSRATHQFFKEINGAVVGSKVVFIIQGIVEHANIFSHYKQAENHFTNGLASILRLSKFGGLETDLSRSFFLECLSLPNEHCVDSFRVLGIDDTTADAEFCGDGCCIWFETKIVSGTLREEQVRAHLDALHKRPQKWKRLVLLTPDDCQSEYVRRFVSIDHDTVAHMEWRRVYNFLERSIREKTGVLPALLQDFLDHIRNRMFSQDIAGIVAKVRFGKRSAVLWDSYLEEMKSGKWTRWKTPTKYNPLDGTGRKLLLYDKLRGGITVEVEINGIAKTDEVADFPWSNEFAGKPHIFASPIPLEKIESLDGFKTFGTNRCPYQRITREQYPKLTEGIAEL
jgi:hypothetical protein